MEWIGIAFGLTVSAGLLWAGRWCYGIPSRILPQWCDVKTDDHDKTLAAKIIGTALIAMAGVAAMGVLSLVINIPGYFPHLSGIAFTVFLRPSRPGTTDPTSSTEPR